MAYSAQELFKDWYIQGTKQEPSASELTARRASISRLLDLDNTNSWFILIKLFYGLVSENSSEIQFFIDEIRKDDVDLPLRNNYNLLRVMAGCVIAQKIEANKDTYFGDALSLALLTAPYGERVAETPLNEVVSLARAHWLESCAQIRETASLSSSLTFGKSSTGVIELPGDITGSSYTTPATFNTNNEKIKAYLQSVTSDINGLRGPLKDLTSILSGLDKRLNLLSEESNVFWWLYNGFSRDLESPFAQLGLPTMCVIAPKELADLTISLPGLINANALLYKALQAFEVDNSLPKLSFSSIIESSGLTAPSSWLSSFTERIPAVIEEITPCLYALHCYDTYGQDGSWKVIFKKKGKFDSEIDVNPIHFAQQLYLELLLIRVYEINEA